MKKFSINHVFVIAGMSVMLFGCASSRAKNLIAAGDDVSAIELLAPELVKKPDSKDLVPLFDSIYPSAVEKRLPTRTLSEIKKQNLSSYGSSISAQIKSCLNELGVDRLITDHNAIRAVINQGESSIKNLNDLSRIQRAVSVMPAAIGGDKTGYTMLVEKYVEKFPAEYEQARKDMGQFYYELAEAAFPGTTVSRKKELVSLYKKAAEYDSSYSNNNSRLQQLSYEIAMILKESASNKTELSEVISYFQLAGSYKDAATQIVYVKYALAELYRAEENYSSYEQAGKLYSECGNYKNAANETRLYNFYKSIKNLSKSATYSSVSLSSGSYTKMNFSESISDIDEYESRLSASIRTSDINVYTPAYVNTIYPGAVVSGASMPQQKFTLITSGSRNPVDYKLISSGKNLGEGTLKNPASASESSKQIRGAAKMVYRNIYPEYSYDFKTVYTAEELKLAAGLGADGSRVVLADSDYWRKNRSYTLVTVTQKFYTAELIEPKLAIDLFAGTSSISTSELGSTAPYYITSVDYGRKAYFVICSELSSEHIINDVKKYRPRDPDNSGSYTTPDSTVLKKWNLYSTTVASITNSEKTYSITNLTGMFNWIQTGISAYFSYDELSPISCKAKCLTDKRYAILSSSTSAVIANPNPNAAYEREQREREEKERLEREQAQANVQIIISSGSSSSSNNNTASSSVNEADLPVHITGLHGNSGNSSSSSSSSSGTSSGSSTSSSTSTSPMYSNKYTSLVFVGKFGYYQCDRITTGDEWIYYVAEDDILNCVASWDSSEYQTVYVNGINMTKDKTVYSFRDVLGNNISLDIIDADGVRKHHLLKVMKK